MPGRSLQFERLWHLKNSWFSSKAFSQRGQAHLKSHKSHPYPPISQPSIKISQSEDWSHRPRRRLPWAGQSQRDSQTQADPQLTKCIRYNHRQVIHNNSPLSARSKSHLRPLFRTNSNVPGYFRIYSSQILSRASSPRMRITMKLGTRITYPPDPRRLTVLIQKEMKTIPAPITGWYWFSIPSWNVPRFCLQQLNNCPRAQD